ncbi:MAG: methionine ABC transporter permease [Candidatus Puniceispirillum sp.]|nr:methionine ABC transporter permease [Candidatus Puniceispirillum sp.]
MMDLILKGLGQTLLMVGVATLTGFLVGVPLGTALFGATKRALFQNRLLYGAADLIINALRSIPYIILVILLLPLTRLLVGTSLGTWAASVPLGVAAILLMARLTQDALRQLPDGLLIAAQSMGASRLHMITKVLLPEALPALVSGATLVIINLIGFSAMAGAVGGGGLGDLAIRYGYQRYDVLVMVEIVAILIVLVQLVQSLGHFLTKRLEK